jgi:hypothetical protein
MDMTRIRSLLAALIIVAAGAGTASAQVISAITSRTPSRGDAAGGTTVEILGNGWFSFSTTVAMSGAGTQPTHLVVDPNGRRLTFVTPARALGACPSNSCTITVTSGSTIRTINFVYVARVRNGVPAARKPAFSYDGQFVAFESRYALVAGDTNGEVDIYVRNRATNAVQRVSAAASAASMAMTSPCAVAAAGPFWSPVPNPPAMTARNFRFIARHMM